MPKSPLPDRFPHRATVWSFARRSLTFDGQCPQLMGIVNVTPDSFSDGGKFYSHDTAIAHALQLAAAGAHILDIGGESTRPYSEPVSACEEMERVLPVIEAVTQQSKVAISIDTSKAIVAKAAIDSGAEIINDITGLTGDPDMLAVAIESRAGVCAMHMQGTPQTMQDQPTYANVVEEIYSWLRERRDLLLTEGIEPRHLCLDPGIGFGKTHQHNLTLAAHCWRFHELGQPLLVGHSRKGFIGKVLADKDANRTYGSVGVALALASQGVQILRVHDVKAVGEALQLFAATGGVDGQPLRLE